MKKENLKTQHRDNDFYSILNIKPTPSDAVQESIDNAYDMIRHSKTSPAKRNNGKGRRARFYLGIAAALLFAFGVFGFSNPALAGKIPFIGRIFQLTQDKNSYPGNYSEHSVPLSTPETDADAQNASAKDAAGNAPAASDGKSGSATALSQTCGDITVTLSEASYTEMAMYISLEMYSEEGFPEDFNCLKNMPGYILPYDTLSMNSSMTFDFSKADSSLYDTDVHICRVEDGCYTPYSIEGTFADTHTFLGIVRVDLEETLRSLSIEKMPPEFDFTFTIHKFWGELNETEEIVLTPTDPEKPDVIYQHLEKSYEGPWKFAFPVALDTENTQVKEIMDANADGIGVAKVTKTLYEMKADILLPDNVQPYDYIIVMTDAKGDILDSQGEVAETFSIYGRDVSTTHIYVLDYLTFMDECKGNNSYRLPEMALYHTTVTW